MSSLHCSTSYSACAEGSALLRTSPRRCQHGRRSGLRLSNAAQPQQQLFRQSGVDAGPQPRRTSVVVAADAAGLAAMSYPIDSSRRVQQSSAFLALASASQSALATTLAMQSSRGNTVPRHNLRHPLVSQHDTRRVYSP